MEFMNRQRQGSSEPSNQTQAGTATNQTSTNTIASTVAVANAKIKNKISGMGYLLFTMLVCGAILLASVIGILVLNKRPVLYDKAKLQAVFLNGGQIYFGNLSEVSPQYLKLKNIYYLRVEQQVQPVQQKDQTAQPQQSVSLAKLGCELHGPEDSMVLNRDQILFWEDLRNLNNDQDGQVVKAIREFVKNNPKGQKCGDTATPSSSTPSSSTTPTTTTPATTPTVAPTAAPVKKP